VLFAGFALATTARLCGGDRARPRDGGARSRAGGARSHDGGARSDHGGALAAWVRVLLAALAAVLAAVGAGLWIDPAGLPPLGGRFAGSWTVMLGFLAGWAAWANRRDEARLPALALVALPAGALVAALRTLHGDPAYLAGLVLLLACGVAVATAVRGPAPAR
jgi:hypothetical protein